MQCSEKPTSANDFTGHWLLNHLELVIMGHFSSFWAYSGPFRLAFGLLRVVLGPSLSFWVVMDRFGSLWIVVADSIV